LLPNGVANGCRLALVFVFTHYISNATRYKIFLTFTFVRLKECLKVSFNGWLVYESDKINLKVAVIIFAY